MKIIFLIILIVAIVVVLVNRPALSAGLENLAVNGFNTIKGMIQNARQ